MYPATIFSELGWIMFATFCTLVAMLGIIVPPILISVRLSDLEDALPKETLEKLFPEHYQKHHKAVSFAVPGLLIVGSLLPWEFLKNPLLIGWTSVALIYLLIKGASWIRMLRSLPEDQSLARSLLKWNLFGYGLAGICIMLVLTILFL